MCLLSSSPSLLYVLFLFRLGEMKREETWPVKIFSLVSKTEKIRPEGSRVLGWILVIAGKFLCDWRTVDKAFKNYPPDATSRSRRSIQKETQLPGPPRPIN